MLASLGMCIRAIAIPFFLTDGRIAPYGPHNFLVNTYSCLDMVKSRKAAIWHIQILPGSLNHKNVILRARTEGPSAQWIQGPIS
jgi:hypothetical protein